MGRIEVTIEFEGESWTVKVNDTDTLATAGFDIAMATGVRMRRKTLFLNGGTELTPKSKTLADLGVSDGDTINIERNS